MTEFKKDKFKNFPIELIEKEIRCRGFDPILIKNEPDYTYSKHSHEETKLLVFIKGSMDVLVDNKEYSCNPGDMLIINGNVEHSAKVGHNGCTFYWSEKII